MKLQDVIKNNKRNIIVSFIVSIFLLFAGYYGNNMPLFTGESLVSLAIMETINQCLGVGQEEDCDSVIYINTSFDKSLIRYYDIDYDIPNPHPTLLGNTEITDREKLIKILKLLKNVDYKYLIIDSRFEEGRESDSYVFDSITGKKEKTDDVLFSLINQLDRVVVATHHDVKLINKELEKKAALADYKATVTATNFVRYEYFDSIPYIPLAVYNDLNKRSNRDTVACHIPFGVSWLKQFAYYTQGCNLCYNSLFLDFQIDNKEHSFLNKNSMFRNLEYYNLSKDILYEEDIVNNFTGHYVIIGNYLEDLHDTYAGPQSGCVIIYKALKALEKQKHVVSWIEMVLLLFMYFSISLFIMNGWNLLDFFKKTNNPLLNFMIDISSFTLIFGIFHVVEYMLGRTSLSFTIPIMIFAAMKTYVLLRKKYNMRNKFLLVLLALLSGVLMSFTIDDNDARFKVHIFNSDGILVDGEKLKEGMMISLNSKITFSHPKEMIVVLNKGKNIVYKCQTHNEYEEWKAGQYKILTDVGYAGTFNLKWWLSYHKTSSKDAILEFDDVEYLIGNERPFIVEDPIIDNSKQYYEFIIIDGKYKGKSFIADPDDNSRNVIWIGRDKMEESPNSIKLEKDEESFWFKVIYHNYDNLITIKDKMKIIFIKK